MQKKLGNYLGRGWARNEEFYEFLMDNLVIDDYMEQKIYELVMPTGNLNLIMRFARNANNPEILSDIENKTLNFINQNEEILSNYTNEDIDSIIDILASIAKKNIDSLDKIVDAMFKLGDNYTPFWLSYKLKANNEIINKTLNAYLSERSAKYIYELFKSDVLPKETIFEEFLKTKGTKKAEYLIKYLDNNNVSEEEKIKIEYAMTTADDFQVMYSYFWKHKTQDPELLKLRENAIIRSKNIRLIHDFAMEIDGADVPRLRTILNSYYRHEYRDYYERWLEMMHINSKLKEYRKVRKLENK